MIKHTKINLDIDVKVYLREKKGYFYAVLIYKNVAGIRREKWMPTKLTVRGNKMKAKGISEQFLMEFEIPDEDLYILGDKKPQEVEIRTITAIVEEPEIEPPIPVEMLSKLKLEDLSKEQVANLTFADYLEMYVPYTRKGKKQIEDTTYSSYVNNIKSPVGPYFRETGIALKDLTARDIQDFYDVQLERVTANTVIHYHAIIRLSLCYARKMGYIKENPIEEVEKPEKNQFIGKFYNADELSKVIELTKGTQLEVPVLMGGFYGLRRSEIVGLRWSAFDFENDVFYINHTVTTPRIDGKLKIVAKDRAKTKSSLRALPLDAGVKKRLLEIKERQEAYQRKFKRSYSKEWAGYVMVDELGGLILPNYITSAFKHLLKKNELREIRFHDLRHTCASLLLNKGKTNGVTLKDIQVWLGHSDFSTTANTYSHLDANSKVSSLNTLAGVVNI